MAKIKAKQKAKAKAADKAAASNKQLVAAFRNYDRAKAEAKSYLVEIGELIQSLQLSRAEVVASMIEARGITKQTAESQYSRMLKIFNDPDTLEELRTGKIDLATARERTTKPQTSVKAAVKKQENVEKRYSKWLSDGISLIKEMGADRKSVLDSVNATLKKAGVK